MTYSKHKTTYPWFSIRVYRPRNYLPGLLEITLWRTTHSWMWGVE